VNAQRIALVCLVVLAVVFVVVVSLGAGRTESPGEPGWASFAERSFIREKRVRPRDVSGPCVSDGKVVVVRFGRGCTVTIARRDDTLIRKMILELSDGVKVKGTLKPGGDTAGPVSVTLQTRVRTLELPVVKDGASLDLQCVEPNPMTLGCTVTVR
jgi:hypothetical protein